MSTVVKSDKVVPILARLCALVGYKQNFDIIGRYAPEETCEVLCQHAKTLEEPKL